MPSKHRRIHNQKRRLFQEQRGLCYYCSEPVLLAKCRPSAKRPANLATLDHIIPRSKGGAFAPSENCVVACHSCNCERGNRDAREFLFEKMGLI